MSAMSHFVLLVEDDVDLRRDLAFLLQRQGHSVVTAANGEEALAKLGESATPSVIVLDLMMPVMDGWALRAELLRRPALAQVPVVLLSGDADVARERAALLAADCLTKPVDLSRLYSLVAKYC
jgi:CheY-like chemotaxis protein